MVKDVDNLGRKCDSTAKVCIKKLSSLSQIEQTPEKERKDPAPCTPPYTELEVRTG